MVLSCPDLIRTHVSIVAGSGPDAAATFTGIPSDPRPAMTNEEWRINTQLVRLVLPLVCYYNKPHEPLVPAWLQAPADQRESQGAQTEA